MSPKLKVKHCKSYCVLSFRDAFCLLAIVLLLTQRALAQVGLPIPPANPGNIETANFLSLSSGAPPPLNTFAATVINGGPGSIVAGLPPDIQSFNISIGYGDLATITNGLAAQAIVGLRVRGNLPYQVVVSQISFETNNLQFRGVELSPGQDAGSFILLTAGMPVGTGTLANLANSQINPALLGRGMSLTQLAQGGVNAASTSIISGFGPSTSGNAFSAGNAIEVPVFFLAPTGLALGPINPSSPGTFSANLQFGILPRP